VLDITFQSSNMLNHIEFGPFWKNSEIFVFDVKMEMIIIMVLKILNFAIVSFKALDVE
jgi:hypothetical protein